VDADAADCDRVAQMPPWPRVALTAHRARAQSRFLVQPFHLQEVDMKTAITSASTALPSRFSKVSGH